MFDLLRPAALTRFILLYAAMYAAFGVASPFLPAFLSSRGLLPEQLGLVLGAGTAVRLLSAPLAGRIGDLTHALRVVLAVCIALAASVTLGYLMGHGFWVFLGMSLLHAASLAPITVLADALALGSASPPPSSGRRGFEYGWVRGTGSVAFIVGTLLSGQVVSAFGLDSIVWLQAFFSRHGGSCRDPGPGTDASSSHSRRRERAGGRCSHSAPASAVSESCSCGSAYSRQSLHARCIRGDSLECVRH
jgi:MFS family permease